MFKTIIFLVAFVCVEIGQATGAVNENINVIGSEQPSPELASTAKTQEIGRSEITLIKRELEITQKFIDRILATVYWSLGSVVVLTVLLTGFGWYSNTRLHSRDIEAMRKEVENLSRSLELELKAEIKSETSNASSEILDSISPVEKSLRGMITSLENKIEKRIAEIHKKLNYAELSSEACFHELKGSNGVELGKRIDLLSLATADGNEVEINSLLKRIDKLLSAKSLITHYEARRLSKIINNLPMEYTILTDSIRSGLKESTPI